MTEIKYPVIDSYPPDEQVSIQDLREQGFQEIENAVVMRNKHDDGIIYLLLSDNIHGRRWMPLRID